MCKTDVALSRFLIQFITTIYSKAWYFKFLYEWKKDLVDTTSYFRYSSANKTTSFRVTKTLRLFQYTCYEDRFSN